jgi:peptidoglycan/xylan/chitin deacetylase (PgdA/CDA1 family)
MNQPPPSAIVLTLHGVQCCAAPTGLSQDPAAKSYTISVERLEQLLHEVSPEACCTVRDFVGKSAGEFRVLTVDDGLISDFATAFPLLLSRGLSATFFVTANYIGRDGFTGLSQLKEMTDAHMEIGSHGLTHRYLVTMSRRDALREIQESKARLEQMLGAEVVSFAPVGGHFRNWMLDAAAEAGYRAFATMIPGRTTGRNHPVLLHRNHIQAHHSAAYVSRLLRGQQSVLLANRVRYALLKQLKRGLGMHNYDRLKNMAARACRNRTSESLPAEK